MTIKDVRDRLRYFDPATSWGGWDDEEAHSVEDSLWADVLGAIAKGDAEDPREMARLALTTFGYDFARWRA